MYIRSNNTKAPEGLVQYIVRAPLSKEKILAAEDKVIYNSKINPSIRSNFRICDPLNWIAAITVHIPDKGQQMTGYYGSCGNVKPGEFKRKNKIAAFVKERLTIDKILFHKGLLQAHSHFPPQNAHPELIRVACHD